MPHQCVRCSLILPQASEELLKGCAQCGSHFFFYLREEQLEKAKEDPIKIPEPQRKEIEKDVREIAGVEKEDAPVILDLESVRITGPGKFEIDVVNLFNEKRPLIYKLEEGKYLIDLATTLGKYTKKSEDGKKHEKEN